MNETQRAAAERLADDLQRFDGAERESLRDEAAALLRELLAEQWLTSAKLDACMASRDALRDWAQECRDQVLYLLAQRDDELGRLADGFGQASVALMRELLAEPVINQQMTTELAEPEPAPGYCKHCKQYTIEQPLPAEPDEDAQYRCGGPGCDGNCCQPVQEPVIWIQSNHLQHAKNGPYLARTGPTKLMSDFLPLYAAPQQRKPLTKVQITELAEQCGYDGAVPTVRLAFQGFKLDDFARAIERMHGIKETP